MRLHIIVATVLAALADLGCCTTKPPLSCLPPANSSQPVSLRPQETNMWCWAASGEMVMDFLGTDVTQCDEANKRFGMTTCCNNPIPGACVQGGWPQFDQYGFTNKTTSNKALTWAEVQEQVHCKKKPFAFSWHWDGGGGHMMAVSGYATIDGTKYVRVLDPWPPNQGASKLMTYDAYVDSDGYSHWDDYYDVTK
jgi:hypothetical protein